MRYSCPFKLCRDLWKKKLSIICPDYFVLLWHGCRFCPSCSLNGPRKGDPTSVFLLKGFLLHRDLGEVVRALQGAYGLGCIISTISRWWWRAIQTRFRTLISNSRQAFTDVVSTLTLKLSWAVKVSRIHGNCDCWNPCMSFGFIRFYSFIILFICLFIFAKFTWLSTTNTKRMGLLLHRKQSIQCYWCSISQERVHSVVTWTPWLLGLDFWRTTVPSFYLPCVTASQKTTGLRLRLLFIEALLGNSQRCHGSQVKLEKGRERERERERGGESGS